MEHETSADGFSEEQQRVGEIIGIYKCRIEQMEALLERAELAVQNGDLVAMQQIYEEMKVGEWNDQP